jgi:OmpA-OmpF porin, OOP family
VAATDLLVSGEPLAIPELSGLSLTDADATVCAQAFQRMMSNNVINFESGSASIDPDSLPLLRNLASVALRCDRFTIEIAGHTDNQGARALNLDLSRRRAENVAAYLENLNVARERLKPIGLGPDQPVASNASLAGQAANRRIVFSVRE